MTTTPLALAIDLSCSVLPLIRALGQVQVQEEEEPIVPRIVVPAILGLEVLTWASGDQVLLATTRQLPEADISIMPLHGSVPPELCAVSPSVELSVGMQRCVYFSSSPRRHPHVEIFNMNFTDGLSFFIHVPYRTETCFYR